LTAGTTGLGWGGAVGDPLGVVGFGVVPFVGPAGPAGTMPGRLWSGWDSGAGMAVEGAAGEDPDDGAREPGGAMVVVGEGGWVVDGVVQPGLAEAVLAGAVDGGEVVGLEGDCLEGGGQAFPLETVTSLRVRFTLAAHAHKLHDPVPCPTMVAPLPFTVMGLVTTGRPLAPAVVPSIGTT
jgi:hypothetical protein